VSDQPTRTRGFVAEHMLQGHSVAPDDRRGCLICESFNWGFELAVNKPSISGTEVQEQLESAIEAARNVQ